MAPGRRSVGHAERGRGQPTWVSANCLRLVRLRAVRTASFSVCFRVAPPARHGGPGLAGAPICRTCRRRAAPRLHRGGHDRPVRRKNTSSSRTSAPSTRNDITANPITWTAIPAHRQALRRPQPTRRRPVHRLLCTGRHLQRANDGTHRDESGRPRARPARPGLASTTPAARPAASVSSR